MRDNAGSGADRDRMVAAEHKRHHVLIERLADDFAEALARLRNLAEILRVLLAVVLLFRLPHGDVADILDLPAKLLQPLMQAGNAQRRRPHIDAAAARAQVHRHPDDANFFGHDRRFVLPL